MEETSQMFLDSQAVADEAEKIYKEEFENDGFNKACQYYKDAIDSATTDERKLGITRKYVGFLIRTSDAYDEALRALDAIKDGNYTQDQIINLYSEYYNVYYAMGNEAEQAKYSALIDEVYNQNNRYEVIK